MGEIQRSVEVIGQPRDNRTVLGFAIPSANRVYVHYDRVHALARHHKEQPGWFLGVVIAHELGHILLPRAGHTEIGVMVPTLSPLPKVPPAFTHLEAQSIRARLAGETAVARLRLP
jgi:hypothetical protein